MTSNPAGMSRASIPNSDLQKASNRLLAKITIAVRVGAIGALVRISYCKMWPHLVKKTYHRHEAVTDFDEESTYREVAWDALPNSYGQRAKSPKFVDASEGSATDYSIFIGYGTKAKRIKDRWEATKRLLRFENNSAALKWLLDSFVDEYLRSKHMEDTVMATSGVFRKDRRVEDTTRHGQARQMATRSPPKTRFEEVPRERQASPNVPERSSATSATESRSQSSLKDHKARSGADGVRIATSSDVHMPGQYSYKYVPEYWRPYYWAGGVPVNPRIVNVGSVAGYPGYMMKTNSLSSLPTRDPKRTGEHLKRWGSATAVKDEPEDVEKKEKRPAVNLGFKTKSMPNLQFIPKETEGVSEDELDIESDPESQGDLMALSSSSLSMPNLHKIPGERVPLLSPPSARRYEQRLRDRHEVGPSSSLSMPNLQTIHGVGADERKKTIRDFVINRLTKNDGENGNGKTKIFNPNGLLRSPRGHDSEKKLVIRRRLLQRIEAKRQFGETHTEVSPRQDSEKMSSRVSMASKLPRISENRDWPGAFYSDDGKARIDRCQLAKEDSVNNNWRVPMGPTEQAWGARGISWNEASTKKGHSSPGIWNPADVHVKKETVSEDTRNETETATAAATTNGQLTRTASSNDSEASDDKSDKAEAGTQENKDCEENSEDEEENVDVETYKETDENEEAMDDSADSESELADDACEDGKRFKRTRKPDHPRKRLKAV